MPKTKLADDEAFMQLYSACLSGVASQLEHMHSIDAGLSPQDLFAKDLSQREASAVKRAFRLARLAQQELEIAQFNQEVSTKL